MLNAVAADAWVATARRGACLFTGRDAVREVPMKVLFADTVCIFYIWYLEYWNYICILECSEIYGRALHTSSRSGLDMVTAHRLIQNEPPAGRWPRRIRSVHSRVDRGGSPESRATSDRFHSYERDF